MHDDWFGDTFVINEIGGCDGRPDRDWISNVICTQRLGKVRLRVWQLDFPFGATTNSSLSTSRVRCGSGRWLFSLNAPHLRPGQSIFVQFNFQGVSHYGDNFCYFFFFVCFCCGDDLWKLIECNNIFNCWVRQTSVRDTLIKIPHPLMVLSGNAMHPGIQKLVIKSDFMNSALKSRFF